MNDLIKIKDMSIKYDISARTLRYYEDMGLITSTRSGDYAYRLYDGTAVRRLEQILILRKLNISIKDIRELLIRPTRKWCWRFWEKRWTRSTWKYPSCTS